MKTFHYYDKSKWDDYQLCSMKPVSPILTVESDSILNADKVFKETFGTEPGKTSGIVVSLGPITF